MKSQFDAVFLSIDEETTRIAEYVQGLLAKIAEGGMTKEEEAAALADATARLERLKSIGKVENGTVDTGGEQPLPVPVPTDGGEKP